MVQVYVCHTVYRVLTDLPIQGFTVLYFSFKFLIFNIILFVLYFLIRSLSTLNNIHTCYQFRLLGLQNILKLINLEIIFQITKKILTLEAPLR